EHDSKEASQGRWFLGLNPGDSYESLKPIREAMEACDLLIIGGDPFQEISMAFYRGLSPYAALLITLAKFLGKPVMLHSIHMGRPLKTELGAELTRFCVTNSDAVTLRESFSEQVLLEMGIATDNCHVVSDTAWGLDIQMSKEGGLKLLAQEGINLPSNRKIIGFNIRHQYWNWDNEEWAEKREIFAKVCDYMIEDLDTDILFIPNCTYNLDEHYEDDRPVAKEIVEKMMHKKNTHQIVGKYNLSQTLSFFPLIDMHISNRRHSAVFAALHSVPPIACGGEWHIKPAMDEIGIGDAFVKLEEWSFESFKKSIDYVWSNQSTLKSQIREAVPQLRANAISQADIAASLISR
ncbi:MAG: hypothetical protein HOG34_02135, partial [Bacteroidetes bacterium]|nr:hypothetical protein [Bacteroidota bacterium]